MFKHAKNRKGLTLIEVIVALAILGIIATSFLTMFTSSFSTIFSMGRRTQAMNDDAQQIMEQLYEDYQGTKNAYSGNSNVEIVTENQADMKLVTVTVYYENNSGRKVTLSSLIP